MGTLEARTCSMFGSDPDPISSIFKVVSSGMCRVRARSHMMLWDQRFYSQLTRQRQDVVDYYRFLDRNWADISAAAMP